MVIAIQNREKDHKPQHERSKTYSTLYLNYMYIKRFQKRFKINLETYNSTRPI